MKKLLIYFLTLFLISCGKSFDEKSVIYEGIGVDDYKIKSLTPSQVKDEVNGEYRLINYENYSTEIRYEQKGISFYYLKSKPSKILAISFNKNFKGKTSRGFNIKKMNVSDMLKIYGKPRWYQFIDSKEVSAHYDDLGICFSMKGLGNVPNEFNFLSPIDSITLNKVQTFYTNKYKNQTIEEINVGIPNTDY